MPTDSSKDNCWPDIFPPVESVRPDGIIAAGGSLTPKVLLAAYSHGIFPWYSEDDPILWWCPDPRFVLFPANFHISSRSRRKIRNSGFKFSCDQAFGEVLLGCADRAKGTWLLPEMQEAYTRLRALGYAHSIEIWQNGIVQGGLYGIALGKVFFGESMFHYVSEASRAALCVLLHIMQSAGFRLLDCQQESPHMESMGAANIPRSTFLELLEADIGLPDQPHEVWQTPHLEIEGMKPRFS